MAAAGLSSSLRCVLRSACIVFAAAVVWGSCADVCHAHAGRVVKDADLVWAASKERFVMTYWTDWSCDSYPVPGAMGSNGSIASNADFRAKIEHMNALSYAFLEVSDDGSVCFSDPGADLRRSPTFVNYDAFFGPLGVCSAEPAICSCTTSVPDSDLGRGRAPGDGGVRDALGYGSFQAFMALQNTKGSLRKLVSIGGAGSDASFSQAFKNSDRFASSVKLVLDKTGIDGVDLDFEPIPITREMATQYAALVANLRKVIGTRYIISMAVVADPSWLETVGADNWKSLRENVDYVDVMTYDFHGTWDASDVADTGFLTSLTADPASPYKPDFSVEGSVHTLQDVFGVPRQKIVIGAPAYGCMLTGVPAGSSAGLFQHFSGVARGNGDDPGCSTDPKSTNACSGTFTYAYISQLVDAGVFAAHAWQDAGAVSGVWAYRDGQWTPSGTQDTYSQPFVSYADALLVQTFVNYVQSQSLGGIMLWEVSGDVTPGPSGPQSSLLQVMSQLLSAHQD
eukprot:ANDGO_07325.mRNA.1 Endochitinase B